VESLRRGGAERLIVTTLEHLDRTRFTPMVVSLFGPNPLAEEIRGHGVVVREFGLSGPRDLVAATLRLRTLAKEEAVDVIHTHLFSANVAGRLAAPSGCSVVTTLHNPDYGQEGSGGLGLRRLLDGVTARLFPPKFLAVSHDVENDFRRSLVLEDIDVLYNYIDVVAFRRSVEEVSRKDARKHFGLRKSNRVILHVGRFHPQKDQETLVRAFLKVRGAEPNARLILAGEGPDLSRIQDLVAELGLTSSVRFPGDVADVAALYAVSEIFAFPSRYEAFGIALLEAMAAGLAPVASDVGGIREVATNGSALLVPPGSSDQLAQSLLHLLESIELRQRVGEAALLRAEDFDVSVLLPQLEAVYASA